MPVPEPHPDSRAVVTGASHGIGEALAVELAARGHSLIVTARREAVLRGLADRLTGEYRVSVEVRPADLADTAERLKLAEELAERDISILCANAGVASVGPVARLDPAEERAMVQVNALGVHDLVLAVLPGMLARGAGGIVMSGSAAGNSPIPNNATYSATKAFINNFCESLHGELRGSGVNVTLLAPGPVRTGVLDSIDESTVSVLVPDYLWVSAEQAAKASLDGLERNRMRVIPGLSAKMMSATNQYLPRGLTSRVVGRVYGRLAGE